MTQQLLTLSIDIIAAALTLIVILQLLGERYLPILKEKIAQIKYSYTVRNELKAIIRRRANCQY